MDRRQWDSAQPSRRYAAEDIPKETAPRVITRWYAKSAGAISIFRHYAYGSIYSHRKYLQDVYPHEKNTQTNNTYNRHDPTEEAYTAPTQQSIRAITHIGSKEECKSIQLWLNRRVSAEWIMNVVWLTTIHNIHINYGYKKRKCIKLERGNCCCNFEAALFQSH
jgi:hypothetical protein